MLLTIIMLLAVFLISLYFITQPLFSYDQSNIEIEKTEEIDRETIFLTLNELEFDFKTAKLSQDDYEKLTHKYKLLATSLLKKDEENLLFEDRSGGIQSEANLRKVEAETELEIEQFISKVKMEKK